ncbi:MAG: phosphoglycerate mutase [Deltaproteobacteria bacterium]|nr:MAG: phosphoglycerate mutase [Deltaproteobacteria bacterium]
MLQEEILKEVTVKTPSKIVLLVIDGVGGIPVEGRTELEAAHRPNLDRLASEGICGLTDPVYPGITPGSGPGHLALFGYDPLRYEIGRGVLEALGIGMELAPGEVVARANFATLDQEGLVLDRRAGRIPTERNEELCRRLQREIQEVEGVRVEIRPGREHRFVVKFSGEGLDDRIADTDPQKEGLPPRPPSALAPEAERTAKVVEAFLQRAHQVLKGEEPANGVLMRGFSRLPDIPSMEELFKLTPACIASYPMYRGLAKLVGMEVLEVGETIAEEFAALKRHFQDFDFFYLHVKKTDSFGEDGNFSAKVQVIEEVDRHIPQLLELEPEVIVVTADHSTPSALKGHSWHPNPFLLRSPYERRDDVDRFTEAACARGALGRFRAVEAMTMMLAAALKMKKFGA